MAFLIPFRTNKRILSIDPESGMEIFEDLTGADTSHLELLDPSKKLAEEGQNAKGGSKPVEAINPMEACERFTTARGELDVIIDMVNNLDGGRYLDFRILANKPRNVNAMQDLALESMGRFGHRRAVLEDISARLKHGAAALRAAAARDNAFFKEVVSLQRFWKIRLNPLVAEYVDSPFSVDISLMEGASQHQHSGNLEDVQHASSTAAAAGAAPRLGAHSLIPLVKEASSGKLVVHLDTPASVAAAQGSGGVAMGATAVHRQLLLLQQKLLWRIVGAALEQEAKQGASVSNFTYGLAEQTLQAIASGSSSLQLSSLRALVLEHVTLCRLPTASITEPPRPYVTPLHSLSLLTELGAWIGHIFFRDSLYSSLDEQAHVAKGVRLQWVPTNRSYASAMCIYLGANHRLMLLMQESACSIDGFPDPGGSLSRWAREGWTNTSMYEMPHLLQSLAQQALG